MIEVLALPFMQKAILAGSVLALITGILSVFIVLKKLSFIGVGISHTAFGGVALGILLGTNPYLTAMAFALIGAFWIGGIGRKGSLHADVSIGILFATAMALGVIFLGFSHNYNVDVMGYLFGNILVLTSGDVFASIIIGVVSLIFIALFFKRMFFAAFDEELADVNGIPTAFLYYLFLTIVSFTVVISIKMVGIILVSALLVIPGAIAFLITYDYKLMVLLSIIFSIMGIYLGLLFSFFLNLPSGATIVVTLTTLFLVFFLIQPKRRRIT